MKSRSCPYRNHCHDAGDCEACDHGMAYERLTNTVKRLRAENKALKEVIEALKNTIEVLQNPNF